MKTSLTTKLAAAAAATGLAFAAVVGVVSPAGAATTGNTTATFTIATGALAITVPASTVALPTGTVNTGASSAAGLLGAVAVDDNRGALLNTWTTTITTTTFVLPGATPSASETVAKANVAYSSGLPTGTSGLGTFVPTLTPAAVGDGVTGASWTGAAGVSSADWNPTLTFTLLPSQVAGTYTGTVTHSVA